jgi:hypothetical protein
MAEKIGAEGGAPKVAPRGAQGMMRPAARGPAATVLAAAYSPRSSFSSYPRSPAFALAVAPPTHSGRPPSMSLGFTADFHDTLHENQSNRPPSLSLGAEFVASEHPTAHRSAASEDVSCVTDGTSRLIGDIAARPDDLDHQFADSPIITASATPEPGCYESPPSAGLPPPVDFLNPTRMVQVETVETLINVVRDGVDVVLRLYGITMEELKTQPSSSAVARLLRSSWSDEEMKRVSSNAGMSSPGTISTSDSPIRPLNIEPSDSSVQATARLHAVNALGQRAMDQRANADILAAGGLQAIVKLVRDASSDVCGIPERRCWAPVHVAACVAVVRLIQAS